MAKTPKRALAALTARGETVRGVKVRELTLGTAAVLERIDSPLVRQRGENEKTSLRDMLPTVYVMTRPAAESEELLAEGFDALMREAVRWADGLGTAHGLELARACCRASARLAEVLPRGAPGEAGAGNAGAAGTAG